MTNKSYRKERNIVTELIFVLPLFDDLSFAMPLIIDIVLVSDFHFDLPDELIAQEPLAARDSSRMLHLQRASGHYCDRQFRDLPDLLHSGDLLVFNDTRVFPARLLGRREGVHAHAISPQNPAARDFLHGRIEVFLTRQLSTDPNDWECLVRPGRKIGIGAALHGGDFHHAGEAGGGAGEETNNENELADAQAHDLGGADIAAGNAIG